MKGRTTLVAIVAVLVSVGLTLGTVKVVDYYKQPRWLSDYAKVLDPSSKGATGHFSLALNCQDSPLPYALFTFDMNVRSGKLVLVDSKFGRCPVAPPPQAKQPQSKPAPQPPAKPSKVQPKGKTK